MKRYLAKRLGWAALTFLTYVASVFVFMQVKIHFDFATPLAQFSLQQYYALRESLGLDRPMLVRLGEYMGGLLHFDLGNSFTGVPVWLLIRQALPVTIFVFAVGALVAYALGDSLGRFAAWHRGKLVSISSSALGVVAATAFPPFLVFVLTEMFRARLYGLRTTLGLPIDSLSLWTNFPLDENQVLGRVAVVILVAVSLALAMRGWGRRRGRRWVGLVSLPFTLGLGILVLDWMGVGKQALDLMFRASRSVALGRGSLLLAVVAFVVIAFGEVMFVTRVGIDEEIDEPFVLTARAKGVPERLIRDRHVARNAVIPALAASLSAVPYIIGGMVFIEYEFQMHGLSSLFFNAVLDQDVPLVMGVMVMLGLLGIGLRLVADIAIAALDPRVRIT